jgi:UDP-N-acetyl-D-mannosaminuronic acid dehydrogenase
MALICRELGLDAVKLIQAANLDYKRDEIPMPSPGVGGACLTKDPYILINSCENIDVPTEIIRYARTINELIPRRIVDDIMQEIKTLNKKIDSLRIFLIGFAFKGDPETSDIRGSTTIDVLNLFRDKGIQDDSFYGYDPVALNSDLRSLGVKPASLEEGFEDADIVLIMNNHKSYKNMDIFSLLDLARDDCVFMDGWYTFDPKDIVTVNSIRYVGVGCRIQT